MDRFFRLVTGIAAIGILGLVSALGPTQQARAQAQPAQGQAAGQAAQSQKKVKDQGEYEIFNAVAKDTDPNKRLQDLESWKSKYPETEFKHERLQYYLTTYQQLGKPDKMIETAKELLALDPKDIQGLYYIALLTPDLGTTPTQDTLDTADKAANGLISAEKPAATKQEDWDKAKKDMDAVGHKTMGWVAMQRKNADTAEQQFTKSLQINPNQAVVSYWRGLVIVSLKKPERQSEALYDFARAAGLSGQGALSEAGRKQVNDYLSKAYNTFHGSGEGLTELKAEAQKAALPPAGFKVKSTADFEAEKIAKEEELKKNNPELAIWLNIKQELTSKGDAFFESNLKQAQLPKLRGTLVEAKPAVNSKELVLGMSNSTTREVTLKLDAPLRGKPKVGEVVIFEGVGSAFSKEPFMLTLEAEKAKVQVPTEAAPARPATKKSAVHKKR